MRSIPTIFRYGENAQWNNSGFSVDGVNYYFSYFTLVAFSSDKTGLVCRRNVWGQTTGKHLNWIEPDHSKRVEAEEFNKLLSTV